ncbi:MAG: hypothetical protein R2932_39570 [Caldilineaceae bacterium]
MGHARSRQSTVRATLAHLLGQQYALAATQTPAICAAVGVANTEVQAAYQRLYQRPIHHHLCSGYPLVGENALALVPAGPTIRVIVPFLAHVFLTTPGVSGLLALPIALAAVPPVWGILCILLFGLVNMLTVAALAETVMRSGTARFGLGFLGQLAQEYLGQSMSALVTLAMAINNFVVLIIFFLGIADARWPAQPGYPLGCGCSCPSAYALLFITTYPQRYRYHQSADRLCQPAATAGDHISITLFPEQQSGRSERSTELHSSDIGVDRWHFIVNVFVAFSGGNLRSCGFAAGHGWPGLATWQHDRDRRAGADRCLWLVVLTGVLSPELARNHRHRHHTAS